jgi:hypothetical protein
VARDARCWGKLTLHAATNRQDIPAAQITKKDGRDHPKCCKRQFCSGK